MLNVLQEKAGLEKYDLAVLGKGFGGAGVSFSRKLIGIGEGKLGALSPDGVRAVLAHEIGHIYRHHRPDAPPIGEPVRGLPPKAMEEIEADRFAACLLGSTDAAKTPLLNSASMLPSLPVSVRLEALDGFSLSSCPDIRTKEKSGTQR